MDGFDECGIHYLTAGSINAYRDNPGYWTMRYLYGKRGQMGPAVARTIACREGTRVYLYTKDEGRAEDEALRIFMEKCGEFDLPQNDPGVLDEYDNILPMIGGLCQALDEENLKGLPIAYNLASSVWADGVEAPFLSAPTFIYPDRVIDVKATKRCPTKIPERDLAQMAIHQMVKPHHEVVSIYATTKKHIRLTASDEELRHAWLDLCVDASSLQSFLKTATSKEHALSMVPLNRTNFRWDQQLLAEARETLQLSQEKMDGFYITKTEELQAGTGGDLSGDMLPDY